MRPYLVLTAVIVMTAATFAQQPNPHPGYCGYGCGPYIPFLTTPEVSLQSVSPNPVGASNATTGLIAGATNSTLSQVQASSSSEYPVAVWYQGGAPLMTPQVRLSPENTAREGREMHEGMMHEGMMHEGMMHRDMHEAMMREGRGERGEERASWSFYGGGMETSAAEGTGTARTGKKATHTYTNDDVARETEKNGDVKYNGKTEKI
jgi:hypothetical protein